MNRLELAIKHLYAAFAGVPRPRRIEACPCCITTEEIDNLLKTRLFEISPENISPYASSAFSTVGSKADYLYFLPRILDLTAKGKFYWPDPEITGRNIARSGFDAWPLVRREALLEYLEAVMESAIATVSVVNIDHWMCAISRIGIDVYHYLNMIAASPEAVLGYFEINSETLSNRRLSNSFWELPNAAHDAIVEWFHSDEIRRIPFEAYGYKF